MGWRSADLALTRWEAHHRVLAAAASGTIGLAFAGVAASISVAAMPSFDWIDAVPHIWGAVVILIGVALWVRMATPRAGQLILATGTAHYFEDLRATQNLTLFAVSFCVAYLWVAFFGQLALTWPDGRVTSRSIGTLVVVGYVVAVGTQVGRYVADRPHPPWAPGIPQSNTAWAKAGSITVIVMGVAIMAVLVRRWRDAPPIRRRPSAAFWAAVIVAGTLGLLFAAANLVGAEQRMQDILELATMASALLLACLIYAVQLARTRVVHSRLAGVLLGDEPTLEPRPHPSGLQGKLARALGDPTLRIAYLLDDGSYVDADGDPVPAPRPHPGRALTTIERRGRDFGVIDHDEALGHQREVAHAARAAAGLAIENAYLYAAMQAQIKQIDTSRRRLATAAFAERRRIARDLHDGAQQQLFAVLVLLDTARSRLTPPQTSGESEALATVERAHGQLHEAVRTLRDLTQGIYPAALVEQGLLAAVEALADIAPIPLMVDLPNDRWPPHLEITAYFVITEALANVYKHAGASQATIHARQEADTVTVEIADDGRGGAAPNRRGRGLRGLHDRVSAVGGALRIDSPPESGTRVVVELPVEQP